MKNPSRLMILALTALLALSLSSVADAARMGGGRSFGSRPSFSAPYQRHAQPAPPPHAASQPRPAASPNPAAQHNQAARGALAQRGGLMGLLGGLALGGLLGALFFGGAFEGVNFLDLLLLGGVALVAWKLLSHRTHTTGRPAHAGSVDALHREAHRDEPAAHHHASGPSPAGFDTDRMFRRHGAEQRPSPQDFPADFDARAFLDGAEAAYRQLQNAWNQGELAEIRALSSDKVFAEIQDQHRAQPNPRHTEVLALTAEVLEVHDHTEEREAVVLFDATLREDSDSEPARVLEVWRFTRRHASRQPTWFLDGIQQVEG